MQSGIDQANAAFWDELCGSSLARMLGITDASPASLKKFDDWYMDFYPYLNRHIPFASMRGREVLEVGLGYGTVAQKIAEAGARYTGLDIAQGPVSMANERIRQCGGQGAAQQGSILAAPFADASFDYVVAIGSLHHTGDLQRALDECRRVLRPGGSLVFMVYYAYSYRRWVQARRETALYWVRERLGRTGLSRAGHAGQRKAYDSNAAGEAAPHTDWVSERSLRHLCRGFSRFSARLENVDQERPFGRFTRQQLLRTPIPRVMGLDLYATATK